MDGDKSVNYNLFQENIKLKTTVNELVNELQFCNNKINRLNNALNYSKIVRREIDQIENLLKNELSLDRNGNSLVENKSKDNDFNSPSETSPNYYNTSSFSDISSVGSTSIQDGNLIDSNSFDDDSSSIYDGVTSGVSSEGQLGPVDPLKITGASTGSVNGSRLNGITPSGTLNGIKARGIQEANYFEPNSSEPFITNRNGRGSTFTLQEEVAIYTNFRLKKQYEDKLIEMKHKFDEQLDKSRDEILRLQIENRLLKQQLTRLNQQLNQLMQVNVSHEIRENCKRIKREIVEEEHDYCENQENYNQRTPDNRNSI